MPTVKETPVKGYAHCPDSRCPGSNQERVAAVKVTTEHTYAENGGDLPFVEKSFEHYRFADDDARVCAACGRGREVTGQQRPSYAPLSGFDQQGLLGAKAFNPAAGAQPADPRIAELEAKLSALTAKLEGQAE